MRKLILISAFVSASILASVPVRAQSSAPPAATDTPAATATAATPTEATARPAPAKKQVVASNKPRREGDETKARRIAAKYGVYW